MPDSARRRGSAPTAVPVWMGFSSWRWGLFASHDPIEESSARGYRIRCLVFRPETIFCSLFAQHRQMSSRRCCGCPARACDETLPPTRVRSMAHGLCAPSFIAYAAIAAREARRRSSLALSQRSSAAGRDSALGIPAARNPVRKSGTSHFWKGYSTCFLMTVGRKQSQKVLG